MKLLKIVLIIALLIVISSASSLGIGTITSGDKIVDMADIKEMYEPDKAIDLEDVDHYGEFTTGKEELEKYWLYKYGEIGDDITLENKDTYNRLWSDDKHTEHEAEEPNSLNEWFCDLSLSEKIEIYIYWNKTGYFEWMKGGK